MAKYSNIILHFSVFHLFNYALHCGDKAEEGQGEGQRQGKGRLAERFLVVRFSGLFFCRFQFN